MRWGRWMRGAVGLALAGVVMAVLVTPSEAGIFPHIDTWMIFYHSGLPESEVQFVAEHMDLLDGGRTYLPQLRGFGSEAPVVRYLQYHNGQDDAELHDSLYAFCGREGIEVEDMFLHFYQDTDCWPRYESSSGTVLGWLGGSAPAESLARVPVDYWNSCMYNTGHPDFRRFFARFCRQWMQISYGGYHIDGFMYDNTIDRLRNTVNYLHAPGYPQPSNWEINEYWTTPNRDSIWVNDVMVLLDEVRDSLEQVTTEPHIMINLVGSSSSTWQPYGWYWAYRLAGHANSGILEYYVQWNEWFGDAFFDRADSLAATGMSVLVHATGAPPGHEWCERARLYTLALYHVLARPGCHWGYTSSGYGATPSEYNWFPAIEVDIGGALGPRGRMSQGATWSIWGREYEYGGAVARVRTSAGSFNDPPVVQQLDGIYRPLTSEAVIGGNVTEISLRNNEGAILVKRPEPDLVAPNGGEQIGSNYEYSVRWSRHHPTSRDSLIIDLSFDSGATFPKEIARVPLTDTSCAWLVPDTLVTTARMRLRAHDEEGIYAADTSDADFTISNLILVEDLIDGLEPTPVEAGASPDLSCPAPHPAQGPCRLSFSVPARSQVRLTVYNCLGAPVRELISGPCDSGRHEVVWDLCDEHGGRVASGVYFCRLAAGLHTRVRKVVVLGR